MRTLFVASYSIQKNEKELHFLYHTEYQTIKQTYEVS